MRTHPENSPQKERLDKLMVERALAPTREKAQALIMAGKVLVDENRAVKAGSRIATDAAIRVTGLDHPYVSRGGLKLEGALAYFDIDPSGWEAMDIGASTGGFTHCLLEKGVKRVYAVDVGYGQLAWQIRQDPRVVPLERTNIRNLDSEAIEAPVDLVVVDVSFIGLEKVLEHGRRFLKPEGKFLALVKPQFEAGRENIGRGGVVNDPELHAEILDRIRQAGEALDMAFLGSTTSPITGKKSGNTEFFILWENRTP